MPLLRMDCFHLFLFWVLGFSFDRGSRAANKWTVVLNTGENVTVIQEQELKCPWMMIAVLGTKELYSFGADIYLLLCHFPLLPENHILCALLLAEAIRKLVHWKEPSALLFKFSQRNECSFHFVELSLEMEGEEMLLLQIWIFSLRIKGFGRQSLEYGLFSHIYKVTSEVKLDLRLNICTDICFSQNNS